MTVRIYVRASTKDQDAKRALSDLISFSQSYDDNHVEYVEHFSGTKLDRPALTLLLNDAEEGDILLVESVDRLSRLSQDDFAILKQRIKDKGLRLVVADLPTTHTASAGHGAQSNGTERGVTAIRGGGGTTTPPQNRRYRTQRAPAIRAPTPTGAHRARRVHQGR